MKKASNSGFSAICYRDHLVRATWIERVVRDAEDRHHDPQLAVAFHFVNKHEPLDRTEKHLEQQQEASNQLVRLIDVLFALVLVQGAIKFRVLFENPSGYGWPVIAVVVTLIYYTVVRSFIDWHLTMVHNPYKIMEGGQTAIDVQQRTVELWRIYVDFSIVAIYGFMLLKANQLLAHPGSNVVWFLGSFVALFAAYLLWGYLRDVAGDGNRQFSSRLLVGFLLGYVLLAISYYVIYSQHLLDANRSWRNGAAIAAAFVLMAWFRHLNWSQQRVLKPARRDRECQPS